MELLERQPLLDQLREWLAEAVAGRGRVVAVGGEAGAGKSTLMTAFVHSQQSNVDESVDIRLGACDPMSTPLPLGAVRDMGLAAPSLDAEAPKTDMFPLVLGELRDAKRPTVLVIEDAHWADGATYDLLRYLGRRLGEVPALVLFTYRDDECGPDHPLRVVLGDLAGAPAMRRLAVPRLSQQAVRRVAYEYGLDGEALYRITCGNAFFVSEVVAAGRDGGIPDTVRDAVLARAHRLPPDARLLLDVASAVPSRTERWLLAAMVGADFPGLDACLAAGMLLDDGDGVRFRHELARLAVHGALPLGRRTDLHRRLLRALREHETAEPARLAHHAEAAGDDAAVVEFGALAGRRAALLGAHREAAAHYAAVLRVGGSLTPEQRADLLERRSYECYLTDDLPGAAAAREEALAYWRECGVALRIGDTLRWLSRLYWYLARNADALPAGRAAVDVLEREPPSRELAMAYSNLAQLAMLGDDTAGAVDWGTRAAELGERLDAPEIVVHALNNIGTALYNAGDPRGRELLGRSLEGALRQNLEEHAARAYTNLMVCAVEGRDHDTARRWAQEGIGYCADRDLDSWRLYMTGWLARLELDRDDWPAAAAAANEVLRHRGGATVNRVTPLLVIGLVRARRGDPDVAVPLAEALELARSSGEPQRLLPVAAALAEAAWLAGAADPPPELVESLGAAYTGELAQRYDEVAVWAARFGLAAPPEAATPATPATPARTPAQWLALGSRYQAALAAIDGSTVDTLRQAADWLRALGSAPALRRASARLRELGATGVRTARPSTAANPAGLTDRELEVLTLLAEGLPNAAIASRLVLSRRTVDHHVSAVLRKLNASTRVEAAQLAARLDIGNADIGNPAGPT